MKKKRKSGIREGHDTDGREAGGKTSFLTLVAIDDDKDVLELIKDALTQPDLNVVTASDPEEGWNLILRLHPQIVLLDLVMPKISGMELLARITGWDPGIDVVLLTAFYSTESAVEAIKNGACDYLKKPVSIADLRRKVEELLADARKSHHALQLEAELLETSRFDQMVGRSPRMLEIFARIRRVGPHFRNALVTGPTGSGKELVARALHHFSPAGSGPFVVCDCSTLVETLLESELFGYVKGAFTGADREHVGLFASADGGSLFLDEIGEMPLAIQSKLLRVLQNQEVRRVGSSSVQKVNVRVIAATNRDLRRQISDKQFREDLYYRLSMIEIKVPGLADRKEDLPLLEHHFIEHFSKEYGKSIRSISQRAQAVLRSYSWPGNVRELENVLGNACMMADGDTIDVRNLPESLRLTQPDPEIGFGKTLIPLHEMNRCYAARVLQEMGGNKAKAADALQISRARLYRILLGLTADEKS